ncbi:MAG: CHAT domain-containing protein [Parasphingopyxis sp.]|uniref:CHAT domain-containing protein n=1 Tax=Parasphingopyxis sp. TaxID=1920299 RepID=UPI003F9FF517
MLGLIQIPLKFRSWQVCLILLIALLSSPVVAQSGSAANPRNELARLDEEGATLLFEGRISEATDVFEERHQLLIETFGAQDPRILPSASILGFFKLQINELSDAERYALFAADGYDRAGNPSSLSIALRVLANVYLRQGRTGLARQYLERANGVLIESGSADAIDLAQIRIDQAMVQFREGNFAQAAESFGALVDEISIDEDGRNVTLVFALHVGLGRSHRYAGNFAEAEQAYLRAIEIVESRINQIEQNNPQVLRQIPRFRQLMESSRSTGICLLGNLYLESGDFGQASQRLNQCIDFARMNETSAFGELYLGTADLLRLHLIEEAEPDAIAETASAYRQTLDDRKLAQIANQEIFNRALGFALYADAAWAIDRESYSEGAFRALQQSVIGPATDSIAEMAARRAARETSSRLGELAQQRTELVNEIRAVSGQQSTSFIGSAGPLAQNRQQLAQILARAETELAQIDALLEAEFPDYFALISPQALPVAQTQSLLRPGEAVLLVVPSEFGTHVMAITDGTFGWHQSEWTIEEIDDAVRELRWDLGAYVAASEQEIAAWDADNVDGGRYGFARQTAYQLYRQLIEPVESGLAQTTRLYIVAGGPLATLPFSVLVTEDPQGEDNDPSALRETAWLADRYALATVPSIQSLQLLRRVGSGQPNSEVQDFAGFGDPLLEGVARERGFRSAQDGRLANDVLGWEQSSTRSRMADVSALRRLSRLPGTATELENIRRVLGANENSVRLGASATETAVRSADLSDARVVAFATHGLMPEELDSLTEPGLVLTPPDEASETDDGYLSASEVASLLLDADWVILSACNTATSDDGAGLSSLARSFFYAGARNLLASHWPVNDAVAARLTVRIFELLRDEPGLGRSEAFQRAMREIRMDESRDMTRASLAHPAFWAPFVLIGAGS